MNSHINPEASGERIVASQDSQAVDAHGNNNLKDDLLSQPITEDAVVSGPIDEEETRCRLLANTALLENYGLLGFVVNMHRRHKGGVDFAKKIARFAEVTRHRYDSYSDVDDSFQDAAEAFLRNYHKYDKDKGVFSTYMTTWMIEGISRGISNTTGYMRYPVYTQALKKVQIPHGNQHVDAVVRLVEPHSVEPLSMAPDICGMGYDTAGDEYLERWLPVDEIGLVPNHDVAEEEAGSCYDEKTPEELELVYKAMKSLPQRTQDILHTYYSNDKEGEPMTLEGTSEKLGLDLSRERIRQIVNEGTSQIKRCIEADIKTDEGITDNSNKKAMTKLVADKLKNKHVIIDGVVFSLEQFEWLVDWELYDF